MRRLFFTFTVLLLSACSAEPDTIESPEASAEIVIPDEATTTAKPANESVPTFNTTASIRDLMNTLINPHAMTLWRAVRYVANEDGVQEDVVPETDEDWAQLRASAITLIEAGNVMLVPDRKVDNAANPDTPDYQYTPGEIQALIDADPEDWRYFIDEMQFATTATLEAIANRDVLGLIEKGATINNACEGCHGEFWYRRNAE